MSSSLWIKLYQLAILESDPTKVPQFIAAARYAIGQRHDTKLADGGPTEEETKQLNKALSELKVLESLAGAARRKTAA